MTTTALPKPSSPPSAAELSHRVHRTAHVPSPGLPGFGNVVAEILPLIGTVAVAGPPVILLAGPWVFLALIVTGPFALLVTFVAVALAALVAVTAVIALIGAIVRMPYRLARDLYGRRARAGYTGHASAHGVRIGSPHAAA